MLITYFRTDFRSEITWYCRCRVAGCSSKWPCLFSMSYLASLMWRFSFSLHTYIFVNLFPRSKKCFYILIISQFESWFALFKFYLSKFPVPKRVKVAKEIIVATDTDWPADGPLLLNKLAVKVLKIRLNTKTRFINLMKYNKIHLKYIYNFKMKHLALITFTVRMR